MFYDYHYSEYTNNDALYGIDDSAHKYIRTTDILITFFKHLKEKKNVESIDIVLGNYNNGNVAVYYDGDLQIFKISSFNKEKVMNSGYVEKIDSFDE